MKFTDAFWKWFGDSKVVDSNGDPLVMYHGTRTSFDSFDENLAGNNYGKWSSNGGGIYFTSNHDHALGWGYKARGKGDVIVMPVYLRIEQPFTGSRAEIIKVKISGLEKQNADGIFTDEFNYPSFDATVLCPTQIKAAIDNDGSWDTDDPKIRSNPEYSGEHSAPMKDSGDPIHNLSNTYGDDIYTSNAARYFGHWGDYRDNEAIHVIQSVRGRPNAPLTVYRAVPYELSVDDRIEELESDMRHFMARGKVPDGSRLKGSAWYDDAYSRIQALKSMPSNVATVYPINVGDWVTTVRSYAKDHGESALNGEYKIVSKKVKAKDLYTNGDSIFEFGYDPQ